MQEFKYLNYYSIYSCTGDVDHEMEYDSCFHTVTKDDCLPFMDNHYIIRFYSDIDYIKNNNNNNFCPFNIHQVKEILLMISSYRKFEFELIQENDTVEEIENREEDEDRNLYNYFELKIHIKDSLIWHKFILKMIRSLYEYPFNMVMMDTLKIMQTEKYQQYGLFNVYMFVGYTLSFSSAISMCDDQFVCSKYNGIPQFFKRPALINRINEVQKTANTNNTKAIFNDIVSYSAQKSLEDYFENRFVNTDRVRTYDTYWLNKEMYEERLDIYDMVLNYFLP